MSHRPSLLSLVGYLPYFNSESNTVPYPHMFPTLFFMSDVTPTTKTAQFLNQVQSDSYSTKKAISDSTCALDYYIHALSKDMV